MEFVLRAGATFKVGSGSQKRCTARNACAPLVTIPERCQCSTITILILRLDLTAPSPRRQP